MAPFQKGNTYGKGRKKGSQNKITADIKKRLLLLVQDNMDLLQDDLDHLTPKDRVNAIVNLINYTQPKLKSVEAKVSAVSELSESEIKKLERMNELMIEIKAEQSKDTSDEEE